MRFWVSSRPLPTEGNKRSLHHLLPTVHFRPPVVWPPPPPFSVLPARGTYPPLASTSAPTETVVEMAMAERLLVAVDPRLSTSAIVRRHGLGEVVHTRACAYVPPQADACTPVAQVAAMDFGDVPLGVANSSAAFTAEMRGRDGSFAKFLLGRDEAPVEAVEVFCLRLRMAYDVWVYSMAYGCIARPMGVQHGLWMRSMACGCTARPMGAQHGL